MSGLPDCKWAKHDWEPVTVEVAGHGSLGTHVVEYCSRCDIFRLRRTDRVWAEQHDGSYEQADELADVDFGGGQ